MAKLNKNLRIQKLTGIITTFVALDLLQHFIFLSKEVT